MAEIILEPTGSSDFDRCECCGENSRTVWGLARRDGAAYAAYFVHWTLGKIADHGVYIDLVLGRWGDDATKADRYAVALEYRRTDRGPAFMVIDATKPKGAQRARRPSAAAGRRCGDSVGVPGLRARRRYLVGR